MNYITLFSLFLFIIYQRISSFQLSLQANTLSHDFTLNPISPIYKNIPFQIPTINLCFGQPSRQCLNVVINIGMQYSLIEAANTMKPHFKHQFNSTQSSSFDDQTSRSSVAFPLFGNFDYYILGPMALDIISLPGEEALKEKLSFVLVESNADFPLINVDGYLRMSASQLDRRNNLLSSLYNSQMIKRQAFTLHYSSQGGGKVSFGDNSAVDKESLCDSGSGGISSTEWVCAVSVVRMGDMQIKRKDNVAVFDSVSSAVYAPYLTGLIFLNHIVAITSEKGKAQCEIQEDDRHAFLVCKEKAAISNLPKIHIIMNTTELVIDWKNLMKLTEVNSTMVYVSLFIVRTFNDHHWIIGLPGLCDHSIYFDKDDLKIGIKYLGNEEERRARPPYKKIIPIVIIILMALGITLSVFKRIKVRLA